MEEALIRTELPGLKLFKRGKVRDLYELGDKLLIIATDRISAFDCVMPNGIPGKGRILTQMSLFWFDFVNEVVENHLISADVNQFPRELQKFRDVLEGRSMLVRKAEQIGVECVVRGYLSGSGWREYSGSGSICGIKLPPGLEESDRLPEPIFTPATKATSGHDQNIPFSEMAELVGEERAATLKDLSIRIYKKASEYAESKGIIVADTKFEFGICSGKVILIDEILSPDSSRFWPREKYQPGRPQESFDKQFVRDYLESLGWDKKPPAPTLPKEVVQKTLAKYEEAYNRLVAGQV
ncbi:MAG: phosphoribosylaminoimidazolesuccinocarboxamide synthase [Candidatus Latescibacterota bacterium]|nr:MAG: phosphoribosylaminoimidazolesuccinocarboxamide synthase [Candidatus Latescibacterota bacterium]RKY71502.1 MAG: phosphoribosylaminoimidazolesuccinocarboxamide synthase [Candidatus Latescibacterota bacterium]